MLDDDASDDDFTSDEEAFQSQQYEKVDPTMYPNQWVDWPADLADALGSMDDGSADSGSRYSGSETSHVSSCPRHPGVHGCNRASMQASTVDEVMYFADAEMEDA